MSDTWLIILRQLRQPLIVLIATYAISIFGLALMPGADPQGNPWRLSVFDAFYVMSYTATTIGFGEIPFPFSYAQRLWLTFSIYLSVIGWAYALGSIFALTQNAAFREALARSRFEAGVRRLVDRFYVICGYGQSSRRLAQAFDRLGFASVVIDARAERLRWLPLADTQQPLLGLAGDARMPDLLVAAGIRRANCAGVVALTDDDESNQTIAIETKVLAPALPALARVRSPIVQQTLESFGGVATVNPFETFGFNFGLALAKPDALRLEDWLTGAPGADPPPRIEAPRGHWVLAGYGRFGHAISHALAQAELTWWAIDRDAVACGEEGIVGSGLAEDVLRRAGIERACGLVAGTDSDALNLAIVTAARRLAPRLFIVIRQNNVANRSLIDAARPDMRFVQAQLMAHECVQLLTTPMLNRFLLQARAQSNDWAVGVCERIRGAVGNTVPHLWVVHCDARMLGIRHALIERPQPALTLAHLRADPDDRSQSLHVTALLLVRGERNLLLPDDALTLADGDTILFAGVREAEHLQQRLLGDDVVIDYVRTGREPPRTWVGRWLDRAAA